jgi:hypothetical protein
MSWIFVSSSGSSKSDGIDILQVFLPRQLHAPGFFLVILFVYFFIVAQPHEKNIKFVSSRQLYFDYSATKFGG